MRTPARKVLADNLKTLMRKTPTLGTQDKLATKSTVAQTSISNMLRPDSVSVKNAPRLDQVEKVAHAFGLSTWQLLLDTKMVGEDLADMLMRPSVQDDDKRLERWEKKPEHQELAVHEHGAGYRSRKKA